MGVDWVHRYPADFEALVAINATARNCGAVWDRVQPGAVLTALRALFSRCGAFDHARDGDAYTLKPKAETPNPLCDEACA